MYNNNRYYEPEDDESDKIDDGVAELMKDEYSIEKYHNFAEGISEAKEADRVIIEEMLSKPHVDMDFEALGRKLWSMAYDYMEGYAISHAEENLSSGYLD